MSLVAAVTSVAGWAAAQESRAPDRARAAAGRFPEQPTDVERLEQALLHYRAIAARGGWPVVAAGPVLRAGDSDPAVQSIRQRLEIEPGAAVPPASALFDEAFEDAVRAFQARHGLEVDGIVGRRTRAALGVTASQRVRQIEINLERLRTRSHSTPIPRIEVNIAAQMLRYFDPDGGVLEMRTIVGRRDWPTPVFDAQLVAVVLAPYWNVPSRIAALEVIPAIRKDRGYLARNDMEVVTTAAPIRIVDPATIDWSAAFPHRIRQRPGPHNPLGAVKFMIPNRFDVYLHDTPGRAAFMRADRALSHGCIRLEHALDLADALLRGRPDAGPDSIRAMIVAGRERTVRLDRGFPVMIHYQTAWVEADGVVHFRDDIYGHDRGGTTFTKSAAEPGGACAAESHE